MDAQEVLDLVLSPAGLALFAIVAAGTMVGNLLAGAVRGDFRTKDVTRDIEKVPPRGA